MINFLCVKTGTKYTSDDVNFLQQQLHKKSTIPCNFICLTDNPDGLNCDYILIDHNDYDLGEGVWNKLRMFDPNLFKGKCFYCDLDTIFQHNIDQFLNMEVDPGKFYLVRTYWNYKDDWIQCNSSIMLWNGESPPPIWTKLITEDIDQLLMTPVYRYGIDSFLWHRFRYEMEFWPRNWVYSRLGGIIERDMPNDKAISRSGMAVGVFYHPEVPICMLNGTNKHPGYIDSLIERLKNDIGWSI